MTWDAGAALSIRITRYFHLKSLIVFPHQGQFSLWKSLIMISLIGAELHLSF